MTRPFTYRPPNRLARRAGILLLVLAGLATVLGLGVTTVGFNLHVLYQNPEVAKQLDELKRGLSITDLKPIVVTYGIVILLYAVAAAVLGFLVRGGNFVVLIVALVLSCLATLVGVLISILALAGGSPMPLFVTAAHGVLTAWLIGALRGTSFLEADVPPYQPMRDYYVPPVDPAALRSVVV